MVRGGLAALRAVGFVAALVWALSCGPHLPTGGGIGAGSATLLDALLHATEVQVALAVLVLGGSCWLVVSRHRALSRSLRATRIPVSGAVYATVHELVPRTRLFLLTDERPYAACMGLWRPTIYATTGLVERLPCAALRAALAHEEAHRRRHDPLRLLTLRLLVRRFAAVPWMNDVLHRAELRAEIRADRFALVHTSIPALATALLYVLRNGPVRIHASPGANTAIDATADVWLVGGENLTNGTDTSFLDERLQYLTLPSTTPLPPLLPSRHSWPQALALLAWGMRGMLLPLSVVVALALLLPTPLASALHVAASCMRLR